jgi:outer membrane receptor protein involved in Fe transport
MTMTKLSTVFMAAALALGAGSLIQPSEAFAQSSTAGGLRGVLKDKATGESAVGATVVATSPALVGEQVVITDENGQYFINSLPPGVYTLTIYYNDKPFSRGNVLIQVGKEVVVNVTVDSAAGKAGGETIVIQGSAPIIDQGSTKTGVTITDDYTRNIPTGRTFAGVLGSTAGSQGDLYGTSIAGATSAENIYVVEGINTTDTGFGGISSNLPNEFIQETEVITGGYNAEFGRATGGIVNVVTKQGSNQFKGSVYGYFRPGALYSAAERIQREGSSIDTETNVDYQYDFGAEVGGPIIKDKLWFHVGFNPSLVQQSVTRSIQSSVDKDGNRIADRDANGLTIRERIASSDITTAQQTYFYTAKINGAINQNNQFQISAFGNPTTGERPLAVTRNPLDQALTVDAGAYDVAGKFTSKFNEGKTQIDAVVGFHRQFDNDGFAQNTTNVAGARYNYTRSLYDFASVEGEQTIAKCQDNVPGDMYPGIINCPVFRYLSQGVGQLEQRTNDRTSGVLSITQRVKAAGYHTFKAGIDAELATYDSHKAFSGGAFMSRGTPNANAQSVWQVQQFLRVKKNLSKDEQMNPDLVPLEPDEFLCVNNRAICNVNVDGYAPDTNNSNIAAFIQDSWQVRPNLTLNLGLRWENQTGYVAKELQGTLTPDGETVPDTAYELKNLLSPRLGFIYDPTSEGKSKIFGHWGRFYENVPMDLNVRAFGGEINRFSNFNATRKTPDTQGYDPNCDVDFTANDGDLSKRILQCPDRVTSFTLGEGLEYVTPGLQGQYTQEIILGAEYEFIPDLKFGMNYIHRTLPVVIEDFSTDGGNTYLIGNPGEDFSGEAKKLRDQAMKFEAAGDMALASVYNERADNLDFVGTFDKPVRDYDAVQVTATQRPTKHSLLLASYTYSVAKGNIAGLFSTETGQLDPNITSLYDLPDLMANRFGNSGLDRPHNLKIDGFYQFDFKKAGLLTVGASFRALSGLPANALGAHIAYGQGESYLLPRAAIPRGPVTTNTDVQFSYGYRLSKSTTLEGFVRVFNLFNEQEESGVDQVYTIESANPIVGGQLTDLKHIKTIDPASGLEANKTATPNKNFDHLSARNGARNMQLGFRLTF